MLASPLYLIAMFRYSQLFFFALFCYVCAMPIQQNELLGGNITSTDQSTAYIAASPDNNNKRSMQDIVWSCIATIFACTWVSIHPNIPGPNETYLTKFFRRIGITVLALVVPELIVIWALRQWLVSRKLAKEYAGAVVFSFWCAILGTHNIQTSAGSKCTDFSS